MVWFDPLAGALFIVMVMMMTGHLFNMHMQSQQLQPVHNIARCTHGYALVSLLYSHVFCGFQLLDHWHYT